MSKNYQLIPPAEFDLREILHYIRKDNPYAAKQMRKIFLDAFQELANAPNIGQKRNDLSNKPVRFWPAHRNYMIIYRAEASPIQILRIYNTARDIAGIMH